MDEHVIHRLDEFLSRMAARQPDLLTLLPEYERPEQGIALHEWVLSLPQRRLMEICSAWVLESMRRLRETTPLTNVLLRGCLHFSGEFDAADAAAVSIGELSPPGDPRWEEIRIALSRAVRAGVLIHLRREDRYCIPFPVRLSFEGVDFLNPLERDSMRLRMIHRFAELATKLREDPDLGSPKYWRFANMLTAYEFAVDMMEELLGIESSDWAAEMNMVGEPPKIIAEPLVHLGKFLGRALVTRQSSSGARLLAASVLSARAINDAASEGEALDMLAQFYFRRGEYRQSTAVYRTAAILHLSMGDDHGVVIAMSAMALSYRDMGETNAAIDRFLRACRFSRRRGLIEQEIDTANCAVVMMIARGRLRETIALIQRVIDSHRRSTQRHPAFAELLVQYAIALRESQRPAESRDWLLSALSIARSFLHRPVEARCYLELGRLSVSLREVDESKRWLNRAKEGFLEMSHYGGLAETYLTIHQARPLLNPGTTDEALLIRVMKAAQKAGDMDILAESWRERGLLAAHREDETLALTYFHQELRVRRRTRNVAALVDGHLRMALLYMRQDSYLAAGTEALRAQAIARARLETTEYPQQLDDVFGAILRELSAEQFNYLVDEVSEELETGTLLRAD